MQLYPYRTTYDKLDDGTAATHIEDAGDTIVSAHFLGGRDWVLICRTGEPTIESLTASELEDVIAAAVARALASSLHKAAR